MNIAFFADPASGHDTKWINYIAKNHSVIVICGKTDSGNTLLDSSIPIYPVIDGGYLFLNIWRKQKIITRLKKIFEIHQITIAHSMYIVPNAFWVDDMKFENHIITTRGSDVLVEYQKQFHGGRVFLKKFTDTYLRHKTRKTLNNAKYITSTSCKQQEIIKQFIKDPDKLHLIRTGIDTYEFLRIHDALSKQTEDFVILSNRAVRPLYNIHQIIEAFRLVKEKYLTRKIKLAILKFNVDDEYLKMLTALVSNYRLQEEVSFIDQKKGSDLIQVYKDTSVVIMIPSSDGTPVSATEVMLAKKPLIIGALNYDTDIFNTNTVWQIESFSPIAIFNELAAIIESPESIKRNKIEAAYHTAIEKTDFRKEVSKLDSLYETILKKCDYQVCVRCVLDTNDDPLIQFDTSGICNYCQEYSKITHIFKQEEKKLSDIILKIKRTGKNKQYDCILGISGGADSTYVAYLAKKFGLRPLLVHYDNGWNSQLAVRNIKNTAEKLGFDLYTHVSGWDEFKDLQLSLLKASVIDIELVTDQAISATLYKLAVKHKIKYILSGVNHSTEGILPESWHHWKTDLLNIKSIHKQFGKVKLKIYPTINYFQQLWINRVLKIKVFPILDYLPYEKDNALKIIQGELGWIDHGGKHYESIFTRFYQSYILPKKFKIDKRKAHLSTLICSGQITRQQALQELENSQQNAEKINTDKSYVLKKLELSEEEFDAIMKLPARKHTYYSSYLTMHYKYERMISKLFKIFNGKYEG